MPLRLVLIVIAAFAAGAFIAALWVMPRASQPVKLEAGSALIGGPFSLTDHTGKRVTEADFRGRFMLVTFGFTYCPDVCPTELQVMSAALEQLGDAAAKVTPVFITVDPARDTPAQLAGYVSNFHPRLTGLTGTAEEIKAAAKAFRIYYAQVKDPSSAAEYTMDHSALVYLMDPDGKYLAHFPYGTKAEDMAAKIRQFL
ncbi:MAG: SCO family protein [Pseudomonadota bacterium]|nr:SCO family protein [Pseudomonadota bacterium]